MGDQLLKAVAERLGAMFDPGITLARLGGDEFAVLAESCPQLMQAAALAQRIIEGLKEPFDIRRAPVCSSTPASVSACSPVTP